MTRESTYLTTRLGVFRESIHHTEDQSIRCLLGLSWIIKCIEYHVNSPSSGSARLNK